MAEVVKPESVKHVTNLDKHVEESLKDNARVCVRVLKEFEEDYQKIRQNVQEIEQKRTLLENSHISASGSVTARVRSVPVQQKKSVSYRFLRNYSKNGNRYMNTVF